MTVSRREGPFVAEITGDLLSARRYDTEDKNGVGGTHFLNTISEPLFALPVAERPWFVVHGEGLYAQNAHDALAPLYRGDDAPLLLRCITDLLTTVESKRLRSRKCGYAASAVILAVVLLSLSTILQGFLTPTDSRLLATVDVLRATLNARGPAPASTLPDAPDMTPSYEKDLRTESPALIPQPPRPQQPIAVAPADGWDLPHSVRAELPAKLRNAASRGLFTVPLSSGHTRTIYVFADPACPNCQRMERYFETVSGIVNVVIFPVTIEGREASLKTLTPVMALPEADRPAAWKQLFAADAGIGVPGDAQATPEIKDETQAETARGAIGINEVAFRAYRLPGTPWTISDDGRYVPQSVLSSPAALTAFLNGGGHDGQ